ncbi:DNA alkylation repair protein [Lignipirellula cremea]|uniref:DNA alkylation repair enzyme n=1 Tax=Lignipirellula cremea TaxID=2528010 RepID=A0A518DT81_9BACT|nr:DNA alkylation repair protein [Lignipirellula cremea]QDU95047.1 DNA alkylation repair enzyme [Lignipirellula cremea]
MSQIISPAAVCLVRLQELGDPQIAQHSQRFFKTGPGEYGEGDLFLGIRVPVLRRLVREFRTCDESDLAELMASPWHEARLLGLLILVDQYQRGEEPEKRRCHVFYRRHLDRVNNWDLVDSSAPTIVGDYLRRRSRGYLHQLARSRSLWRRRIAIIATLAMIREDDWDETLALAEKLLQDPADLLHKAVGWMLREVGKRDAAVLARFLERHAACMPRTMLRYAIESMPEPDRRYYRELPRKSPEET